MRFSTAALVAWYMAVGGTATAAAFTLGTSSSSVARSLVKSTPFVSKTTSHSSSCACPACQSSKHGANCACPTCLSAAFHPMSCTCIGCGSRRPTFLFADVTTTEAAETAAFAAAAAASAEEVPESVTSLDGIANNDEAHNAERPARKELKKKSPPRAPRGKPLSEFQVGSTVTGKVRKIADYGAFVDFGGATDGLLHISQLSEGFVANVKDILAEGQEIQVRIVNIDEKKGQVGLSMMTAEQQTRATEAASIRREQREGRDQNQQQQQQQTQQQPRSQQEPRQQRSNAQPRRDDSATVELLNAKGWDTNQFIEGTVVSIVEFGAFVRFDASALNAEVQGEVDGLVHISALNTGRVQSVKSVVKVDEKVKIRLKSISGNKVSLTMISPEDEQAKMESGSGGGGGGGSMVTEGAKDWKESVERIRSTLPTFMNRPMVVDLRNGSSNNGVTMSSAVELPDVEDIVITQESTVVAQPPAPEVVVAAAAASAPAEPLVSEPEIVLPAQEEQPTAVAEVIAPEPEGAPPAQEEPVAVTEIAPPAQEEPVAVAEIASPEPAVAQAEQPVAEVAAPEPEVARAEQAVAVAAEVAVPEPEIAHAEQPAAVAAPEPEIAQAEQPVAAAEVAAPEPEIAQVEQPAAVAEAAAPEAGDNIDGEPKEA